MNVTEPGSCGFKLSSGKYFYIYYIYIDTVGIYYTFPLGKKMSSIPTRGNELLFVNIFVTLLWQKPGVEFRHSKRNASKNEERSVLSLCSLCAYSAVCGDTA